MLWESSFIHNVSRYKAVGLNGPQTQRTPGPWEPCHMFNIFCGNRQSVPLHHFIFQKIVGNKSSHESIRMGWVKYCTVRINWIISQTFLKNLRKWNNRHCRAKTSPRWNEWDLRNWPIMQIQVCLYKKSQTRDIQLLMDLYSMKTIRQTTCALNTTVLYCRSRVGQREDDVRHIWTH